MTETVGETADGGAAAPARCWSCRQATGGEPFCPECGKIQPLARGTDYFRVFELPRRLGIDAAALEPTFHALSRQYHPDRYRLASSRERLIALENAALLNQAYRALRDPFERVTYLVRLEEGGAETGGAGADRSGEAAAAAPQELFEEILEIQELLGELRFAEPEERGSLRGELARRREQLQAEQDRRAERLTGELARRWDALAESAGGEERAPLLAEMRRILGERAYLRRVLDSLGDALKD